MGKIYQITEDYEERSMRRDDDYMLEKAFKEGCEHGYRKAMRDTGFDERGGLHRINYREGFEEKIERLKEKYR